MKRRKGWTARVLAMLMCVVMLFTMLPVSALAEEEPITIVAAGDIGNEGSPKDTDASEDTATPSRNETLSASNTPEEAGKTTAAEMPVVTALPTAIQRTLTCPAGNDSGIVSVSGIMPENAVLSVKVTESTPVIHESSKLAECWTYYDITLGEGIQPEGAVQVSIPIPLNYEGQLSVWYIQDGVPSQKMNIISNDGIHCVFETDHFSVYGLKNIEPISSIADTSLLNSTATSDAIDLNSNAYADKISFSMEYRSGSEGWNAHHNGIELNGNEELKLKVSFSNLDSLDLKQAGNRMTYQAPDILRMQPISGNMISNGIAIGQISVDNTGLATIHFNETWVQEQIKLNDAGEEIHGGIITGDFSMTGRLNLSELPGDVPEVPVVGDITVKVKNPETILAEYAEIHVEKTAPRLSKVESDGVTSFYLDYTVTVRAGQDGCPSVRVEDYFTEGANQIIEYDLSKATETPSAEGRPMLAANRATGGITWTVGDMAANEVRTLSYSVKIKPDCFGNRSTPTLSNEATLFADRFEREDDIASYKSQANATVRKTSESPTLGEDGNYYINYTVTLTANSGNSYDITNITLRDCFGDRTDDRLEPYIHYASKITITYPDSSEKTLDKPDENSKYISTVIEKLAPGESAMMQYTMRVDAAVAAVANNNLAVKNRAQAYDHSGSSFSDSATYSFSDKDVTIDSKQWARKNVGRKISSDTTLTASGILYDATGSTVQPTESSSVLFEVPAGSFEYKLVVNETGDWNIKDLLMTDRLKATDGVNYQNYAGYVKVEAYSMPENPQIGDDAYASIGELGTLAKTVWVKVDGMTSFTYTPAQIGLESDGTANYALRMTYYAKPNADALKNKVRVEAGNSFGVSGDVIGPSGNPVKLENIEQNVSVTVSGGQEYQITKEAWYYDLNPTAGFEKGTIYWAIRIDTKTLKEGLVIQESANLGSTRHKLPRNQALVAMYRMDLGDRKVAEVYSSLAELQAANTPVDISDFCTVSYSTSNETDMNFKFTKTMELDGEESLYIILRTTPDINVPDRNPHTFTNKLNLSYTNGATWDNSNPQDEITIPASEGIMKETSSKFIRKADGTIEFLPGSNGSDAGKIGKNYLDANDLSGVFVAWVVKVNYKGMLAGDYTVIDHIPEGLEPVFARNKWVGGNYNNSNAPQLSMMDDVGPEWTEGTITTSTDGQGNRTSYFYTNGQQLMFHVTGLKADKVNDQCSVDIQVMCRVTDRDVLASGESKTFYNTVELQNNTGTIIDRAICPQNVSAPSVEKNGEYAAGKGALYPFRIVLNEHASDLVPNSSRIVVVDEMEGAMTFMPETLIVTNNKTNLILPSSEYTVSVEQSTRTTDGGTTIPVTILKVDIPDETAVTIAYQCMINAKPDEPVSIANRAHWEGKSVPEGGEVSNDSFQYSAEGQVSSTKSPQLKLTKVDGMNTGVKLSGAKFEIATTKTENGQILADIVMDNGTTDTNGIVQFLYLNKDQKTPFEYNTVYAIRETEAPAGYMLNSEWVYWMVMKEVNGSFPEVPAGVQVFANGYEFPMTAYNYKSSAIVQKTFTGEAADGNYHFGIWDNADASGHTVLPVATINYPNTDHAEFYGLEPGKEYYIFEIDDNGNAIIPTQDKRIAVINEKVFFVSYENDCRIWIPADNPNAKPVVTVTNEKQQYGGLKITKTLAESALGSNQSFVFAIKLADPSITGTYSGVSFRNGFGEVTLKGGESKVIENLPSGTGYTVTEGNYSSSGYILEAKTGDTGTIAANTVSEAEFTNGYKAKPVSVQFSGHKTLTGRTLKDAEFSFVLSGNGKTETVKNGAGGSIQFSELTFDTAGIYSYTVKEEESTEAGIISDSKVYHITVTITDNGSGQLEATLAGDTQTGTDLNFTNEYKSGSLTVSKALAGNAADSTKDFEFIITLGDESINETYSEVEFRNGEATISLRGGESKTIAGLPNGISYTVTEADYSRDGYITTVGNQETKTAAGIISEAAATAAFTNERNTYGGLTVTKTVGGNAGDTSRSFSFTVTLQDALNHPVSGTFGEGDAAVTFTNGSYSFSLKHNDTITINGIPNGTKYTVSELDYSSDGYVTTKSGETGIIEGDALKTAVFTNNRDVGSFTVRKLVNGNAASTSLKFDFTITLTSGLGNAVSGTFSGVTFDENGTAVISLAAGESKTIDGLVVGTRFTVREHDYSGSGYDSTTDVTPSGIISKDTTPVITFTNTRNANGLLTIEKVLKGNGTDSGKEFEFTITLKNGNNPVTGTFSGVLFDFDGTAVIKLKGGEKKVFDDIPNGTSYTVTEKDYSSDFYTCDKPNGAGGTVYEAVASTETFTNTRNVGTLKVSKLVTGNAGDKSKEFTFTVTLMNGSQPCSGTFGGVAFDKDGKTSFTLKDRDTKTITGIPAGITYKVTENADGYTSDLPENGTTGTINQNTPAAVTVTNTLNTFGNLTVSKKVEGNAASTKKAFSFTVTLSDTDINGTYGDMTFKDGVATFSLKHGESATATGLPNGITYTVTEARYTGYTVRKSGESGKIIGNQTATAAFTNVRNSGSGDVAKTGDPDSLLAWVLAVLAAVAVAAVTFFTGRRKKANKQ